MKKTLVGAALLLASSVALAQSSTYQRIGSTLYQNNDDSTSSTYQRIGSTTYRNDSDDRTGLRLVLDGFEAASGKFSATGAIQLLDPKEKLAAAWPFVKLLDHWKAKHAHAAFVPSQAGGRIGDRQYRYGRSILLGEGAEFRLFLNAVHEGKVYYDPGIKLEGVSTDKPKAKKRSQFRVNSKDLSGLYVSSRIVDACQENGRNIGQRPNAWSLGCPRY